MRRSTRLGMVMRANSFRVVTPKADQTSPKSTINHSQNSRRKRPLKSESGLDEDDAVKEKNGEAPMLAPLHKEEQGSDISATSIPEPPQRRHKTSDLDETKWKAWSKDAHSSPFPDFPRPTEKECRESHRVLESMHGETVRKNFDYTENPEDQYPYVMDALIVATLSQATSWENAKRAMRSMTNVYGSPFAYQAILDGGEEKLKAALRPGGMQNRKAKMVLQILEDVKGRYGKWDLNHLFGVSDEDAVKELLRFKGVGPKSAFCILSICLQRNSFAVDTHIYRIAGLWGWRPASANREKAQAHLDARIPDDIKFSLHYLLIVHGRECPRCRGNGNASAHCEYEELLAEGQTRVGNR